jgi:hypothetical protein
VIKRHPIVVIAGCEGPCNRLARRGAALAEVDADSVDWHQVARLLQRGCSPQLAVRIVR